MSKKVTVSLQPLGKYFEVIEGTPMIDVLHEYGVEFPCAGKGTCGRCRIKLLYGKIDVDSEHQQKLENLNLADDWRLACFCKADSDVTIEVFQFEEIILADESSFSFNPQQGYGIAIDVGTTTLVVQLLNLYKGHVIDVSTALNPQLKHGSDLISRIQNCLEGRQEEMQKLIHLKLGEMINGILDRHQVNICKVVLVGNTVMHHIFSGLNMHPLSFYPFEPHDLGVQIFSPVELGWKLPEQVDIRFLPAIGSFVGSDILAGIAATKMAERKELTILLDLGTNGEIVLGNSEKIICASTAAGPAFEGAKINQGMRAVSGAISSVWDSGGQLHYHVIGNVPARGICGSGLIDAMAVFMEQGKIGMFGEINSGEDTISLGSDVCLTQQDIREFQLAKAAIAAGLQILLNMFDITFAEVENIYIAGGFGNFLNLQNVIKTGLIETSGEKIIKMGNTALIGAKIFLFNDETVIQNILRKTKHINLEADPLFQDIFIEKLMLY
jgi:uncharacterized 2Fe-2S/4Fe-4S cluster protein (DUF4445 family)